MSTLSPPISNAQVAAAGLGHAHMFAAERARIALMDRTDFNALGLVGLLGDVAGMGTDTIRTTHLDGVGFATRMTAMGSEVDPITPSAITMGYSDVTVAMYNFGHSQTFHSQVLDRPMGHDLNSLIAMLPATWTATVRYLACVKGAAITDVLGSATAALDVDTWLSALTYIREIPGAAALGMPRITLSPQQGTQLIEAFRSEPAYGESVAEFAGVQGLVGQTMPNFAGLGMDVILTDDVQQSGGAYQGFGGSPGFMGWARASTSRVLPTGIANPIYLPEIGVIIAPLPSSVPNATSSYGAWAWIGVGTGSTDLYAQFRIRSVV